ncbi:hypothetical protein D3C86_1760350 [compost metagenome]
MDGFHVPLIPSLETLGKTGAGSPLQNAGMGVNNGAGAGPTTIAIVTGEAHCPGAGVKV